ncbi:nuclear receptor subfamily 0 group B member 1-like [Pholidichthys leucotaenia]
MTIRALQTVFKAASDMLVKTFRFVKNMACFWGLPAVDQLRLVHKNWAPLLVLGLVQNWEIHVVPVQELESLAQDRISWYAATRKAFTSCENSRRERITSAKERQKASSTAPATVSFQCPHCPYVPELECLEDIHELQSEAERVLYKHMSTVGNRNPCWCRRLCGVLSTLRSMDLDPVAGLFFRPVTGMRSIEEHVLKMFYEC